MQGATGTAGKNEMMADNRRRDIRFNELPPDVQEFLMTMRRDDVRVLRDAMELARSAQTMGRFAKWFFISVIGTFITIVTTWDTFMKMLRGQ